MILTITKGAHARNVHLPAISDEPRHFAHRWDPDEGEDVPHQAQNFVTYARALGGFEMPVYLIAPPLSDDEVENDHIRINMEDWRQIVETGQGWPVEMR